MRRLFFFLCSFFYICMFASIVSADGMVVPRPGFSIDETDQKAVIWHDGKTETLIVSITFEGSVDDFAWIIPVPSKPEVEAGVDELFTGLERLTVPRQEPPVGGFGMYGSVNLSAPSKSAVTVIETKRVDIYDISILTAESSSALQDWLEKNGYEYPRNRQYLLESYINKGWYFVAAKINTKSLSYAGGSLRTGHATPLKIRFASEKIIYPLKISGKATNIAVNDTNDKGLISAFSFENGATQGWSGIVKKSGDAWNGDYVVTQAKLLNGSKINVYDIRRVIDGLDIGKEYVLSAYVKANRVGEGEYVYLSTGSQSKPEMLFLKDIQQWTRVSLPFLAGSNSIVLQLNSYTEDPTQIYWDGIMVEEGATPSSFITEYFLRPSDKVSPISISVPDRYLNIIIYVFSDHKITDSSGIWHIDYAGKLFPKTIEKLAYDDNGDPWVKTGKSMYLTKLSNVMTQGEMTSDLYFQDADNNSAVGSGSNSVLGIIFNDPLRRLVLVFGAPLLIEISVITYIFYRRYKR